MSKMHNLTLTGDLAKNICLPERIVLTDNGAADLEAKGINGYYVWIGYEHKAWASERKMNALVATTAQNIAKYLSKTYSTQAIIQDYIKDLDMYRVYVQVDEKV